MLIKIPVNCIVVDTLHLRMRIIEKFISSVLSSIVNKERNTNIDIIETLNKELQKNNFSATIHVETKGEFFIKYKLRCSDLKITLNATKVIIDYIKNNYQNCNATKLIVKVLRKYIQGISYKSLDVERK